jgi:16S rRNA (adenine1518-N6/adenine1519-N6)-dimethyltransferase
LPYNVATPVVANLVAGELPWHSMLVTIQLELAERIAAQPGTRDYSALTVWLGSQCAVKVLKRLPPSVFWPRPKVDSAIVRIEPNEERGRLIGDRKFLRDFLRKLFQQRRKLLRSNLVGMFRGELQKPEIGGILQAMGLPKQARAEELKVTTLVDLANRLQAALSAEPRRPSE